MPDSDADSTRVPEDDMLPDEREAVLERLDELEDEESHLTIEAVAENLGIDLE